jgi:hypothetical protein
MARRAAAPIIASILSTQIFSHIYQYLGWRCYEHNIFLAKSHLIILQLSLETTTSGKIAMSNLAFALSLS